MVRKVKLPKKNKKDKVKKDSKSKKVEKSEKVKKADKEEPEYGVSYVASALGCSHLKVQKYLRVQEMPRVGRYYDLKNKKAADRIVKELS